MQGEGFPRSGGSPRGEHTAPSGLPLVEGAQEEHHGFAFSPRHPPAHGAVPGAGGQGDDLPSGATCYPGVSPGNWDLESSCIFQTNVTDKHCSENIFKD